MLMLNWLNNNLCARKIFRIISLEFAPANKVSEVIITFQKSHCSRFTALQKDSFLGIRSLHYYRLLAWVPIVLALVLGP